MGAEMRNCTLGPLYMTPPVRPPLTLRDPCGGSDLSMGR